MSLLERHRSSVIITGVALLLGLWVLSGALFREPPEEPRQQTPEPMTVAVHFSQAEPVERVLTLQGEVEADQRVVVRAETSGRISEVPVALGQEVDVGTILAHINMDDREARLRRAQANVRGRETDHQGAQRLAREGMQAQLRVETTLAELEAARADLEAIQLDIRHTRIQAPIAGVVNHRYADVGDVLSRGDPVAELLQNDPLRAVVQVPQHSVHRVRPGGTARITLMDGERRDAEVSYISARAETATRTFRVELTLPNPDRALPAGISVQVQIPVEQVMAHRVSPALAALDDQGRLGVKAVDEDDRVVFHPVALVRADSQGVWVSGLPAKARIITIGHGFVNAGETVRVADDQSAPRS
ncbi:MAG: efflux RND transporter periplasmic adaptor subunit [Gammaproteobacteria bacterium]|nr:MAG: efflux RND transporter periplasmic adaptor subunit [Gammaproteobacteria bacterium]